MMVVLNQIGVPTINKSHSYEESKMDNIPQPAIFKNSYTEELSEKDYQELVKELADNKDAVRKDFLGKEELKEILFKIFDFPIFKAAFEFASTLNINIEDNGHQIPVFELNHELKKMVVVDSSSQSIRIGLVDDYNGDMDCEMYIWHVNDKHIAELKETFLKVYGDKQVGICEDVMDLSDYSGPHTLKDLEIFTKANDFTFYNETIDSKTGKSYDRIFLSNSHLQTYDDVIFL